MRFLYFLTALRCTGHLVERHVFAIVGGKARCNSSRNSQRFRKDRYVLLNPSVQQHARQWEEFHFHKYVRCVYNTCVLSRLCACVRECMCAWAKLNNVVRFHIGDQMIARATVLISDLVLGTSMYISLFPCTCMKVQQRGRYLHRAYRSRVKLSGHSKVHEN